MKTHKLLGLAAVALSAGLVASCDLLKDVEYSVEPCPLEMHGDSVEVTITAKIGEKGMNKKAYIEFTPMIGDTKLKTVAYQGEKATGNGKVIPATGGTITYTDKVAYTDAMENTDLKMEVKGYKGEGGKEKLNETTDPLCVGTIITPYRHANDDKVILATDEFVRPTNHDTTMVINFLKDKDNIRTSELKEDDYKGFVSFMGVAKQNPKLVMESVQIDGHASPEGEEARNQGLSERRANNAKKQVEQELKKMKYEEEMNINTTAKGEDVQGFKELVAASDIEDKNEILTMINNYSDKVDQEIKNLSKTYKELEKDILPKLRRARVTLSYKNLGLTDEELVAVSKSNPDSLTMEELLFTANLTNDLAEKLRLYKECERQYPNDWRGPNNVGAILYMQGKTNDAKSAFERAAKLDENGTVKNNIAAITRQEGDRVTAKELLEQASGAGDEVNYNLGIIAIQNGNYGDAVSLFGSYDTYNKALAQMLNGDTSGALTTLDNSEDKETAKGYYLKAIIGARTNNQDMLINNLKSAIAKDSKYKAEAAKDMEFYKWMENDVFKGIVG